MTKESEFMGHGLKDDWTTEKVAADPHECVSCIHRAAHFVSHAHTCRVTGTHPHFRYDACDCGGFRHHALPATGGAEGSDQ